MRWSCRMACGHTPRRGTLAQRLGGGVARAVAAEKSPDQGHPAPMGAPPLPAGMSSKAARARRRVRHPPGVGGTVHNSAPNMGHFPNGAAWEGILMGGYLLQIAAGSAAGFGVYAGFSHLAQHVPLIVVFGAAFTAGLWMTIVANRIYRLRERATSAASQQGRRQS